MAKSEKWRELALLVGAGGSIILVEGFWTSFLIYATSKIPIIGIPGAALFGLIGTGGIVWSINTWQQFYEEWWKEYHE